MKFRGRCRGENCQAPLFWPVPLKQFDELRAMPVSEQKHDSLPESGPRGWYRLETRTIVVAIPASLAPAGPYYESHHATCPDVDQFPKKGKEK